MDHLLRATSLAEARHFWFRGFRFFVMPLLRATRGVAHPAARLRVRHRQRTSTCSNGYGRAFGFDLTATGLQIGRRPANPAGARDGRRRSFPSNAFDVVTSFDVLYSLDEPVEQAAVSEMYRLIRPGGYVLVNVAAMESCAAITRCSATKSGATAGRASRRSDRSRLRIVRITYTNASLFLPMVRSAASQRVRGLRRRGRAAGHHRSAGAVNAVLTAALAWKAGGCGVRQPVRQLAALPG